MTHSTLERRVEEALETLARMAIADDGTATPDQSETYGRSRSSGVWAAVVLLVVAGIVALAAPAMRSTQSPSSVRTSEPVEVSSPTTPTHVPSLASVPVSAPPAIGLRVAMLDPAVADVPPV